MQGAIKNPLQHSGGNADDFCNRIGQKGRSTMQPWEQPIEIRIASAQQSVLKKIADAPLRRIAA